MLSSDEGDTDIFFDSVDSLSAHDSILAKEELDSGRCGGCDYEIWVNEPLSVKERRERFLRGMGLADTYSSKACSQEKKMMSFGAVSNPCIRPANEVSEKLVLSGQNNEASEAKVLFDELKESPQDNKSDESFQGKVHKLSCTDEEHRPRERKNWWKGFVNIRKGSEGKVRSKLNSGTDKKTSRRIKARQNKKRWLEFSGLYIGQEIKAHKGLIWAMKFSPNGKYLASGGEDGVVRLWRCISMDTSSTCFTAEDSAANKLKHSSQSFIFLPHKVSQIEESPVHEFYGHSSDVLDLAWSNSDILLSCSTDTTVRMWQIGCNQCLSVFHHKDYVTCIQFNPVDENHFISGSIDGKVRIWGIREERVIDWADIGDVISAITYQQDGKGFVVGSFAGTCRFYVASGKYFQLEAQIHIHGKKKAAGNKITGIQFSHKNHQIVMITSEDSKIRIFNGTELIKKYRGLPKSRSQMSGSFTSSGQHIISVGEDSNVYIWNFSDLGNSSSKHAKSKYSCEYFFSKGVTVAVPWSGMKAKQMDSNTNFAHCSSEEAQTQIQVRDSERFSLGNWFSLDGPCRGSMTWPEEKLPNFYLPLVKKDDGDHQQLCHKYTCHDRSALETWGLSIVTAGCDGTIKTFHNFGLPLRI